MGNRRIVYLIALLALGASAMGMVRAGDKPESPGFYVVQGANEAARQRVIEEKLDKPLAMAKTRLPLQKAVEAVAKASELPLWINNKTLADAGVELNAAVEVGIPGASVRTVLETALGEMNLGWRYRGDAIEITTLEDVSSRLLIGVYPVQDLVAVEHDDGTVGQDFDSIIELLTSTVACQTWDKVGGPASITHLKCAGVLVVNQFPSGHREIGLILEKLNAARAAQGLTKVKLQQQSPSPSVR